jgi:hypothetical protein
MTRPDDPLHAEPATIAFWFERRSRRLCLWRQAGVCSLSIKGRRWYLGDHDRVSGGVVPWSYIGGMRWWPNLGPLESPDATWPFARLDLSPGGVTCGPSSSLVPLVPTLACRWEDLTVVESLNWLPVPFIASGVRFRASDTGFIFWTGSSRRSKRILDFCDASAPGLVNRERRRASIYGSG